MELSWYVVVVVWSLLFWWVMLRDRRLANSLSVFVHVWFSGMAELSADLQIPYRGKRGNGEIYLG